MGHTLPALLGRTSGVIAWAAEVLASASGVIGRAQGRGSSATRGVGRACRPLQSARPRGGAGHEQAAQASGLAGLRGLRDRRVFIASLRVSRLVPLPKTLVSA